MNRAERKAFLKNAIKDQEDQDRREAERAPRPTDIFVKDRLTGRVHRVGAERHDALLVVDGQVRYYNLQNGDGTTPDGCGGYELVEKVMPVSGK